MSSGPKGSSSPKTALPALLLCQGVLVSGLALSFPFLTLYLHERRGMAMGLVGLSMSAALAATAVGQAIGGELSDVWGCKRVMGASLAARAALTALLAVGVERAWPVAAIVGLHLGTSLAGNLYGPALRAWIAHEHPISDRPRAFGLLRVATNAAWAVGPAVGGAMAGYSYGLMFAATAAICALCLALLVGLVPSSPPIRSQEAFSWSGIASAASDRRCLELGALTLLIACAMGQLVGPLSVHATTHGGLSEAQVGLLFTVNGVMVVLFQRAATSALAGMALTRAAAIGCLFYAAGWSWVGFARGWWPLALGMAVVTIGEIIVSPSLETLAANLAPARLRGRYMGFQGLSQQLGQAMGPLFGGMGLEHWSGRWTAAPWLAAGALAGAAGWGFRRLERRLAPAEQGLAEEVS